MVKNGINCF